jgi:hypothetical protein
MVTSRSRVDEFRDALRRMSVQRTVFGETMRYCTVLVLVQDPQVESPNRRRRDTTAMSLGHMVSDVCYLYPRYV